MDMRKKGGASKGRILFDDIGQQVAVAKYISIKEREACDILPPKGHRAHFGSVATNFQGEAKQQQRTASKSIAENLQPFFVGGVFSLNNYDT
ncbi:hypothetical protein OUZ56_008910 [Daphnia magna]|uniref:Uncharacterized protein n=1 Tax=Daphnia magna TaxID=35525 RepID=A0ABR0AEE8_9CRUS|nr:hypothetical protein OUZ56_008910 [Daphnia magna]